MAVKYESPSACKKRSFKREWVAKRKAEIAEDERGSYQAYKCEECKMWHIGHPPNQAFNSEGRG